MTKCVRYSISLSRFAKNDVALSAAFECRSTQTQRCELFGSWSCAFACIATKCFHMLHYLSTYRIIWWALRAHMPQYLMKLNCHWRRLVILPWISIEHGACVWINLEKNAKQKWGRASIWIAATQLLHKCYCNQSRVHEWAARSWKNGLAKCEINYINLFGIVIFTNRLMGHCITWP